MVSTVVEERIKSINSGENYCTDNNAPLEFMQRALNAIVHVQSAELTVPTFRVAFLEDYNSTNAKLLF